MGVHLAVLQEMTGIDMVVLYGGMIISKAVPDPTVSRILFLTVMLSEFIGCLGAAFALKKIGRKFLLQLGTAISLTVMILMSVSFLAIESYSTTQRVLVIFSMYLYIIGFGFTMGPVLELYIPEIVPARMMPWTSLSGWVGASIIFFLFPILGSVLGNFGYLFVIHAVWCSLALVVNQKCIVESMGKT